MSVNAASPDSPEQTKRMKVLFVLPDVRIGGIERVRMTLIEQFIADGIDCRLALRRCRGELIDRARTLAPVDELAPGGIHQFIPALAKLIRREQPTHLITAFSDVGLLVWIALRLARSRAKWIHSVHSTHSKVGSRPGAWGRMRYWLENRAAGFVYRRANTVVAVSEGIGAELMDTYHINQSHVVKIWNPVVPDAELMQRVPAAGHGSTAYSIACVGRLVRLKGFDILIEAMSAVRGSWNLDVWGVGPEHDSLQAAISRRGMQTRIRLRGYTSNPYDVLRHADLFVLPSRHEGLPATLIEALASRCQIVATNCLHGPSEILEAGRLGQLVPVGDPIALAKAINAAREGDFYVPPEQLVSRAKDFSRAACCARWESLLRSS